MNEDTIDDDFLTSALIIVLLLIMGGCTVGVIADRHTGSKPSAMQAPRYEVSCYAGPQRIYHSDTVEHVYMSETSMVIEDSYGVRYISTLPCFITNLTQDATK